MSMFNIQTDPEKSDMLHFSNGILNIDIDY